MCVPVCVRSTAYMLLEHPAQVLRILESQCVGNFTDSIIRAEDTFLGKVYYLGLYVFLGCHSGLFLDHVPEIVRGKAQLVGKIPDCGQSAIFRMASVEVFVQKCLETGNRVPVYIFTCDELRVVESHAILEKQSDVHGYESLAVLVDGVSELGPDDSQTVEEHLLFPFRDMEGFV